MGDAARTRAALDFVCRALHKAGILYVDAECLRLAKHDDSSVRPVMWALVVNLLDFLQDFRQSVWTPRLQETGVEPSLPQKEMTVFRLMLLGYPRTDRLENARELLLAVGFLLGISQLLAGARCTALPPYPNDIASLDKRPSLSSHSGRQTPESDDALCNALCEDVLQLHGRWHAEMRRIEQLESHRICLLKQIRDMGYQKLQSLEGSDRIKKLQPPTLYELFVLERALLQEHVDDLQKSIMNLQTHKARRVFYLLSLDQD